jgi:hypothetical protein
LSSCYFVKLPFCQVAILSSCHFVKLPVCQVAILSSGNFVNATFCAIGFYNEADTFKSSSIHKAEHFLCTNEIA